jgi:hypothetical protein
MGRLRTEPKYRSFIQQEQYDEFLETLREAQGASDEHNVYFDLEPDEKAAQVKKAFNYVARKEGIDVTVRQVRGSRTLVFQFKRNKSGASGRMSADESRRRILKCLKNATKPLKKNQIIKETGISASTWNIRIKELLEDGDVTREGDRRDTTYTIA